MEQFIVTLDPRGNRRQHLSVRIPVREKRMLQRWAREARTSVALVVSDLIAKEFARRARRAA